MYINQSKIIHFPSIFFMFVTDTGSRHENPIPFIQVWIVMTTVLVQYRKIFNEIKSCSCDDLDEYPVHEHNHTLVVWVVGTWTYIKEVWSKYTVQECSKKRLFGWRSRKLVPTTTPTTTIKTINIQINDRSCGWIGTEIIELGY